MNRILADIIKGKWRELVGTARVVWDELTVAELIGSEGDTQKLANLIEERYEMSHEEAEKQVISFFERSRTL
ncbi:general stress protein CsbD [Pseudomonas sp. BN414]|uniref:CsbD family protein n=1 Tax=Pseudomonas sp. BN414 TaxID=2567888 RepID=UPI0024545FF2|nr:CsbD family protein [Pseudomonas sp. BN414]MDH4566339.1 general stress protein CsbD [Pseudomonas sp. BN414]